VWRFSVAIRDIDFNPFEKKAADRQNARTVERLQSLEREAGRLERRADVAKGDVAAEAQGTAHAPHRAEGHRRGQRSRLTELKRTLTFIHRGEAEAEQAKKELTRPTFDWWFRSRRNIPTADCSFST